MPNNQRKKSEKTTASVTMSCTPSEKELIERARKITEMERREGRLNLSDFLRELIIVRCHVKVAKFNERQEKKAKNKQADLKKVEWMEIESEDVG